MRLRSVVVLAALAAGACAADDTLADHDEIFVTGVERRLLCAGHVDEIGHGMASVEAGLDRAQADQSVMQVFAHDPGGTIEVDTVDAILAAAVDRGLAFVTYHDLATAEHLAAGLAFGFDDNHIDHWYDLRPVLARHGARVTFFVSELDRFTAEQRARLHALAADGHAIEHHSARHQQAPSYVETHGVDAYLAAEIEPALAEMSAEGFTPTTFAYPYGMRTAAIDAVLLERFARVRSTSRHCFDP